MLDDEKHLMEGDIVWYTKDDRETWNGLGKNAPPLAFYHCLLSFSYPFSFLPRERSS